MDEQEAKRLLNKYLQGQCTPEEKALVERWYQQRAAEQDRPEVSGDPLARREAGWEAIQQRVRR